MLIIVACKFGWWWAAFWAGWAGYILKVGPCMRPDERGRLGKVIDFIVTEVRGQDFLNRGLLHPLQKQQPHAYHDVCLQWGVPANAPSQPQAPMSGPCNDSSAFILVHVRMETLLFACVEWSGLAAMGARDPPPRSCKYWQVGLHQSVYSSHFWASFCNPGSTWHYLCTYSMRVCRKEPRKGEEGCDVPEAPSQPLCCKSFVPSARKGSSCTLGCFFFFSWRSGTGVPASLPYGPQSFISTISE